MISKERVDFSGIDFHGGESILIDKPFGWSSFKVVYEIRNAIGWLKVGHAGTLDPFATGLLILCTGKKTKSISDYQDLEKTYSGVITLGKATSSMDLETEILCEKPFTHISDEQIYQLKEEFTGNIMQVPPMFSAIKQNGKNLYKLAREGKTVERQPREINVTDFNITKIELPDIHFEISCSKGTYLRVIANDFGEKLGCGGVLSSLQRSKIGHYSVENALSVELFKERLKKSILN
ncbi:MAG: tRNA pseudouridine(55) synthase TruB [Ignavibacteriaceae bacterium]|nr:tRNA pseudouridine(55) synthase TruB [Ignavibacteriaceae bacterium]